MSPPEQTPEVTAGVWIWQKYNIQKKHKQNAKDD